MTQACTPALSERPAFDRDRFFGGLIGKPWSELGTGPESFDCWGLVGHVQKIVYHRIVPFAADHIDSSKSLREIIDAIKANDMQRHWLHAKSPKAGDIVVMARAEQPVHVGIWIDEGPGLIGILHCVEDQGVILETLAQARASWLKVEFRRCVDTPLKAVQTARFITAEHCVDAPFAVIVKDMLNPLEEAEFIPLKQGSRISDALAGLEDPEAHWVVLNDTPLLRCHPVSKENELEQLVGPDDIVWVLPPLPEGGGDGSRVLATILTIVISLYAPYAAAAITGVSGPAALGLGGKLLAAGIAIGGNLLVAQFIPPPPTVAPLANPEPTYSFGTQNNQLRPGALVNCNYGTMRRRPDLLARPWAEFAENDQLIHVLLCVGQGEYRINSFGVGDTSVWTAEKGLTGAIADVEFEIVQPGDQMTLFPSAIEVNGEVDGIELPVPAEDIPGEGDVPQVVGSFIAVQAGATASELVLDFVFPRGLFSQPSGIAETTVDWKIEARQIDEFGRGVGFWATLEDVSYTAGTTTPQRLTRRYPVAIARYEVRVSRTSASTVTGGAAQDQLVWLSLKAKLADVEPFSQVTALALRVRADATSSQAVQEWFVDATRILPHCDPDTGALVTGPTEAIEAAALDIIQADYGLGLSMDQIDMPQLKGYASTWAARGDVCCTSIEDDTGAWDVLEKVLKAGRARPFLIGGMVTFMRDEARAVAPKLITHADMVRGTFEVDRAHHRRESPNVVTMRYRDRQGAMRTLECQPDGVTNPRPATVITEVMVDAEQVWREGLYMAATNNLRRRFLSWVSLAGAGSYLPGQLIDLSHPRPQYGRPSRIAAIDWPVIELTTAHALADGQEGWMSIARPNGDGWGPVRVIPVPNRPTALRVDELDFDLVVETGLQSPGYSNDPRDWVITEDAPSGQGGGADALTGRQSEPTRIMIGTDDTPVLRCMVVEVRAREAGQYEVLVVEEAAAVHEADQKTLPEQHATSSFATNSERPFWRDVVIVGTEVPDGTRPDRVDFTITGPAVPGAVGYLAEVSAALNPADWQLGGQSQNTTFEGASTDGIDIYIRVAAVGPMLAGPWTYYKTDLANVSGGKTVAIQIPDPT